MADESTVRRPLDGVCRDLREALRPPACRALENLADVLHYREPRWPAPTPRAPRMLDFTVNRGWGHDITWRMEDGGRTMTGSLWHPGGLALGDWLGMPGPPGPTLYRITEARWAVDPDDMWHYRAEHVPGRDAPTDLPEDTCRG